MGNLGWKGTYLSRRIALAALLCLVWLAPIKAQENECLPFAPLGFAPQDQQSQQAQPGQAAPSDQDNKTPQSQTPPAGDTQQDKNAQAGPNGTSKDRLFYTLPNFLTLENSANVPPMTAGEKFKAEAKTSFDPIQIAWYGFLAGLSQAENSEPGYGQGAQGYGKRYGAAAADGTIENFMVAAVFPAMLHQDPRFFQSGHGSFMHRALYAWSRIIITRGDSGNSQFNFSEVFGSALSAGISTYSYHPHADKTVDNTLKVWGTQVGWDSLTYVIKEFWPDIRRWVHKKHSEPATANPPISH
jgi:hypothetical protein